jgi:hypothetical protein
MGEALMFQESLITECALLSAVRLIVRQIAPYQGDPVASVTTSVLGTVSLFWFSPFSPLPDCDH